MKKLITCCMVAGMAAALSPAFAETSANDRMLKAPPKTMGDEGKLPATEKMGSKVRDMTGPRTAASPGNENTVRSGPKGPPKRMGDEGTLPATNKMGSKVPQMNSDN